MSVSYVKIVKQQLHRRLREFGLEPKAFLADLSSTDARITGSFALQIILGETFADSDLDIFCHAKDYIRLHNTHITSKHFKWVAPPKKPIVEVDEVDEECPNGPADDKSNDESKDEPKDEPKDESKDDLENYKAQEGIVEPSLADIVKVESYTYQGTKKVQFVIIKDSVPIMEHIDKFDISFCKVSFDGKKFNVPNSKNTMQKIGFAPVGLPLRPERLAKYKARGFKIYQEL